MPTRTLPVLLLALLTACAAVPSATPSPPVRAPSPVPPPAPAAAPAPPAAPAPALATPDLLAYADRTYRMPAPELAAEIARLSATPDQPLELALALSQTRQPPDTARALALVQRVLAQPDNPPAQAALVRLLENRLLHQRRLEEQADRQAQQIKELQRKNEQLGERLEAVRAIERSINNKP